MIPGIDPKVDIAFKKVFGTPAWRHLTVSLINAVLESASTPRVADLDLLNPYSQKIAVDDKLTILDVKARDEQGRTFDLEMQMELVPSLPQRLLFYWARMYAEQLVAGDDYAVLCPAVSICFLNANLIQNSQEQHSVFRLLERNRHDCLTENLELHVIEIPKFTQNLESLERPLDFWLYFFKNGRRLDADALPSALARPDICRAMEVLKMFSQDELERDLYENRLKAQRDHRAFVRARDEAVHEREQAVHEREQAEHEREQAEHERDQAVHEREQAEHEREQAVHEREQAEHEREQAEQRITEVDRERAQALLEAKRALSAQIRLCQRLSGHEPTGRDTLMNRSVDDLRALADHLEQQLPPT